MDASIIVAIISVIGSFILVYLTTIKEQSAIKHDVRKEQLDKFYIPFYQMYCRGFMSQIKPSEFPMDVKLELLDLMSDNIYLMEPLSQSMYSSFYRDLLRVMDAENGNPVFSLAQAKEQYDNTTQKLIKTILMEYKELLKKCHLPTPLI